MGWIESCPAPSAKQPISQSSIFRWVRQTPLPSWTFYRPENHGVCFFWVNVVVLRRVQRLGILFCQLPPYAAKEHQTTIFHPKYLPFPLSKCISLFPKNWWNTIMNTERVWCTQQTGGCGSTTRNSKLGENALPHLKSTWRRPQSSLLGTKTRSPGVPYSSLQTYPPLRRE